MRTYNSEGKPEVKMIDFGISTWVGDAETLTGCCGSPEYMAPEVLRAMRTHDRRKYRTPATYIGSLIYLTP